MNQQTPGPLQLADNDPTIIMTVAVDEDGDARIVADVLVCNGDRVTDEKVATARLLVASYTAFDGAARALNMDAVRLAEKLGADGLVTLMRLAADLEPLARQTDRENDQEALGALRSRAIGIFNRLGDGLH